ncbi:hypothetical protein JKF63_06731 [Porcisia hertigi]|uniref:Uncharacterized protein n=1 Tax=Porcisia hertigi TaxID=2761500 RepID=A0A836LEM4_9TRYP|nr:hypothetical protein JKF63_06731 [Porcisia hertigi]
MHAPPLLPRRSTRWLGATQRPIAAHRRCPSSPLLISRSQFTTSAMRYATRHSQEWQCPSPTRHELVKPSPLRSSTPVRAAVSAGDEELWERLVECIPRAPMCISISSLYTLFTVDDATTPVFDSPWRVAISANKATSLAAEVSATAGTEKGASRSADELSSQKNARVVSARMRAESSNAQRRRKFLQRFSGTLQELLLAVAEENLIDELSSHVNGRSSIRAHGIYVSFDNLYVTVASSAEEAGRTFSTLYAPLTPEERAQLDKNLANMECTAAQGPTNAGGAVGTASGFSYVDLCCPPRVTHRVASRTSVLSKNREKLAEIERRLSVVKTAFSSPSARECPCSTDAYLPYFGETFEPPPPPAMTTAGTRYHSAPTSFSPLMLAGMLSTHFVPVEALLKQLPYGYTVEHIRRVFGETMTLEVVELAKVTYVRFHGGKDGEGFTPERSTARVAIDCDARAAANDGDKDDELCGDDVKSAAPDTAPGAADGQINEVRQCIAAYEPDPYLFYSFLPRFSRPYQWMSLYDVVEHASPTLKTALLPFSQHSTLMYFAQQQHRVQFSAQHGGAVCLCFPPVRSLRAETTPLPRELAEVKRFLQTRGLVFVSEMEAGLADRISDSAKRRIIAYFGTLRRFLYQHEHVFRLSVVSAASRRSSVDAVASSLSATPHSSAPLLVHAVAQEREQDRPREVLAASVESSALGKACSPTLTPPPMVPTHRGAGFAVEVVPLSTDMEFDAPSSMAMPGMGAGELDPNGFPCWLASADLAVMCEEHAISHERSSLSPEERLELASTKRNRSTGQRIRRRMAVAANPNSPYTNPEVLLDTMLRYLPPTRHIGLRSLLQALPPAITDFLPVDPVRLFRNAPAKVQLFEFRVRNNLRVMRPGLPLPDGRLRSTYTVDELLHMLATDLPQGRSRTSIDLFSRLPYGARETIRLQHHHLIDLVEQYPQYFIVVYPDAESVKKHLARIQLIQRPPLATTLSDDEWDAGRTNILEEELHAVSRQDYDTLMADLPLSLRETLSPKSSLGALTGESKESSR